IEAVEFVPGPSRGGRSATLPRPVFLRRPVRRAVILGIAAAIVLAAVAAAIGFGLPGLRIVFAPQRTPPAVTVPSGSPGASPISGPSATPSAKPGPPGSALGLGRQVTVAEAARAATFPLLVPGDARFGAPDTVWIDDVGRVTLVWATRPGLPETLEPGVSLIVTEFPGHLDTGYFGKILDTGATIENVSVGGSPAYWIAGSPHDFVYVGADGQVAFDRRRMAGDTLAWSRDPVTYRIETSVGRDEAIRIAESMHGVEPGP
ncbi:MAG TPA: hypothetical protein VGO64_06340, partial [Candidatus Limnocylindrales bacterium]|nr:hypothetical protein [Candidatus Limnocylindrales bacterium]